MDENTVFIVSIVSIATNVIAPVDYENTLARTNSQALGQYASRIPSTHNQIIKSR